MLHIFCADCDTTHFDSLGYWIFPLAVTTVAMGLLPTLVSDQYRCLVRQPAAMYLVWVALLFSYFSWWPYHLIAPLIQLHLRVTSIQTESFSDQHCTAANLTGFGHVISGTCSGGGGYYSQFVRNSCLGARMGASYLSIASYSYHREPNFCKIYADL